MLKTEPKMKLFYEWVVFFLFCIGLLELVELSEFS